MTIGSAAIMLLLVLDPVGNAVSFISILEAVPEARRTRVLARELAISLGILLVFLFFGRYLLALLRIEEPALSISGGIVLFLISLKMIFPPKEGLFADEFGGEPFVVPLATPLIAGPSALAVVLLMASSDPTRLLDWTLSVLIAWSVSAVILLLANPFTRLLGRRGTSAAQKLMGMILIAISVQMLLTGVEHHFLGMGDG